MYLNEQMMGSKLIVPQGIKGLIFDMDGTLINSIPVHYQAWLEACKPYGVSFSLDYFLNLTGRPVVELAKDIMKAYPLDITPEQLVSEKEALVEEHMHKVELIKPVMEVIEQYDGKLPMAVGTGASREKAIQLLTLTGIVDRFDSIVTSDDVSNYKPHPDTFLKAARDINIQPVDCMVFEDGQLGIDAAISAGMKVVDVKPFYQ